MNASRLTLLVVVLVALTFPSHLLAFGVENDSGSFRHRLDAHQPIKILSDLDFLAPLEISGVVGGTGTAEDPYLIQGWRIDASLAEAVQLIPGVNSRAGILIARTTAHFAIMHVWVRNGGPWPGINGIALFQVASGEVRGNRLTNNAVGITTSSSQHATFQSSRVEVRHNLIEKNGIGVFPSGNTVVEDNILRRNKAGIVLNSNGLRIARNVIHESSTLAFPLEGAISGFTSDSVIEDNVIIASERGIRLFSDSIGNRISGNRIVDSFIGIHLFESHNNNVTANTILDARIGVLLETLSHGNRILDNRVQDAEWYAFFVHGTGGPPNLFGGNVVKDSPRGFWVMGSSNNIIEKNRIVNGVFPIGLFCRFPEGLAGNVIGENTFVDTEAPPIVRGEVCFWATPPPPLWPLASLTSFSRTSFQVLDVPIELSDYDSGLPIYSFEWGSALQGTWMYRIVRVRNTSNLSISFVVDSTLSSSYGTLLLTSRLTGMFPVSLPRTLVMQPGEDRLFLFEWNVSTEAPTSPTAFEIILRST